MGQKKALFYKHLLLTKRQKMAFGCQAVTPLLSLALIRLLIYLINKAVQQATSQQSGGPVSNSTVIPLLIYPSNLLNPNWEELYKSMFYIENPVRINRWSAIDEETREKFARWITKTPNAFAYKLKNEKNEYENYPKWEYFNLTDPKPDYLDKNKELNDRLIEDLKTINDLNSFELKFNKILPDSSHKLVKVDQDTGVTADVQVNNILFSRYHRKNGDGLFDQVSNGTKRPQQLTKVTESSIGHINLLTNMHLQSIFQDDLTNIFSIVSPMIDSSAFGGFINTALSLITINMFPIALCLGFPIMLFILVMEKEEKIKDLLQINGLVTTNYWVIFFAYNFIVLQITTLIFLAVGRYWIEIDFFQKSSMWIMIWFLSAWNCSQIGMALFVSTFVKKSSSANLVGYTISVFMILFLAMQSQFLFPNPGHLPWLFYVIPQTPLVRYFYLSISRCIDFECVSTLSQVAKGEMLVVFASQHLIGLVYFFLGLLLNEPKLVKKIGLDKLFKKKLNKAPTSPQTRDRNNTGEGVSRLSNEMIDELSDALVDSNLPSSLEEEKHSSAVNYEQLVNGIDPTDDRYVLLVKKMSKSFPCTQGIKHALTNFSLKIEKGKIFGLLGPNGAGKTTFLSLVTGTQVADRGEGWICGNDTSDRTLHSGNIGFCPQFDILWPLLNVEEHLIFLAMFKGQTKENAKRSVIRLIEEVDLELDYKKLSSQLSGGMKRRCSLAMALTGDPKIIFLDEPSSGLDPVKRRHFWQLVKKVTEDRAVLLTPHLMEEADTLCNDIGIMTTGKLRCIGNSIYMKNTFTDGLKIQVVLDKEKMTSAMFMGILSRKLEDVKLHSEFQGTLTIVFGNAAGEEDGERKLSYLFEVMYGMFKSEDKYILDWSISLGSLEDVFLNVVRKYRESNIQKL